MPAAVARKPARMRPGAAAALAHHRDELEAQHRQHAGHEVEDQTTEQRDAEHSDERRAGILSRGGRALRDRLGRSLQRALAIEKREHDLAAGELGTDGQRLAQRHEQRRLPPVGGHGDARVAERQRRIDLGDHVGVVERLARRRFDLQRRPTVVGDFLDARDRETGGAGVGRHGRARLRDRLRLGIRRRRAGRNGEREIEGLGDAQVGADQDIELEL